MYLIVTVFAVLAVLLMSEYGWRKHWLANEFGRKFVHISVGTFVAFWPFFLSWNEIRLLSLAFLVVVIVSHQFKLFHAINSVQRPTYGEIFFAVSVGLLTYITASKAIYAASILQMSLADGLAAVIGTRFGRDNKYHVYGHTKSIAGTVAFIVTSLAIFAGYSILHSSHIAFWQLGSGALMGAAIENLAPLGLDNIFVPIFVALALTYLA